MKRFDTITFCVLLAATSLHAQTHKPALRANPQQQVLKSLVGRVLYACAPPSSLVKRYLPWPVFYLTPADGKDPVDKMAPPFPFGTKLTVLASQSDFKEGDDGMMKIRLNLFDPLSSRKASVAVGVGPGEVRPTRILHAVSSWVFSTHEISGGVHVGMTDDDLYCLEGDPEHVNSDAIGPDQLVYWGGDRYIYLGKNGRVEDIQESY